MSAENEKFKRVLPPLNLLSEIFVETPKIGTCKISDRKPESSEVIDEAERNSITKSLSETESIELLDVE